LVDVARWDWHLNLDEQVRCLSYLSRHLQDFAYMPKGLTTGLTPVSYPCPDHPYPAILLYEEDGCHVEVKDIPNPWDLEEALGHYINTIGRERLLSLSADENLTWQDVLKR